MDNDRYTIYPSLFNVYLGALKGGDIIDLITGDTIVGPYCMWPKQEPRQFVVTIDNPVVYVDKKIVFKKVEGKIKFYEKLNRRRWS